MPLILGTNSIKDTGYNVANSVRLFSNTYLHKTPDDAGNTTKFTTSFWVKRSKIGARQEMVAKWSSGSNNATVRFLDDDKLAFVDYESSTTILGKITNRKFRDVGAWYHIVCSIDTTQSVAANRAKIFVNGVQETSFSTDTIYAEDDEISWNNTWSVNVGWSGNDGYMDGYMAEVVFIDGLQLAPTSFGEFDSDSGIWKPIDVSGLTFGTNGFYLDFEAGGNLGNDANGGTDLTEVNLAAIDQTTDTCTNNFATLNPLDVYASKTGVLSEGNLKLTATNSQLHTAVGTIAPSNGKWYLEVELDAISGSNNSNVGISDLARDTKANMPSKLAWGYGYNPDGTKQNSGSDSSYGDSYTAGDILGVAMDLDNGAVYFSKNGTFQASGDPTSGASKTNAAFTWTPNASMTWAPYVADNTSGVAFTWITNFGNPIVTGTDQTDGNSRGSFEYAVPSGYFSLCTKNLAAVG